MKGKVLENKKSDALLSTEKNVLWISKGELSIGIQKFRKNGRIYLRLSEDRRRARNVHAQSVGPWKLTISRCLLRFLISRLIMKKWKISSSCTPDPFLLNQIFRPLRMLDYPRLIPNKQTGRQRHIETFFFYHIIIF